MATIPYKEQVVELVEGKVNEVSTILNDALERLNDFVDEMLGYLRTDVSVGQLTLSVPSLNIDSVTLPSAPEAPDMELGEIPFSSYPESIELTPVDVEAPWIPEIDMTPPNIPERVLPEITIPEFNEQAPSINTDIQIPTRPTYTLPELPQITKPTIPAFEGYTIPSFVAELPDLNLSEFTAQFNYSDPSYSSDLAAKITAWINDVIENGGTGLDPEVEQAIFDAAIFRLDEEFVEHYNQQMAFYASRGFKIPPGALNARLAEVHRLYSRKKQELNKEIMIKQAELAQANTHFAIEKGIAWEGMLREFFNQMAARTLESAKAAVGMAIEIQNAKVTRYNAELEAYKTQASVYEARVRALASLSDAYKAQVDAARVATEIEALSVQIYRDQMSAISVLAQFYEADVRAAGLVFEAERNKMELFKGQIDAFQAQIGAQTAKIAMFNALAENDKAKANVYESKMRGYAALADTIKTRTEAIVTKAQLDNEVQNRAKIEVYKANIEKVDSYIKNKLGVGTLQVQKYSADQSGYEAGIRAYAAKTGALIQEFSARVEYAAEQIKILLKEAELNQQSTLQINATKLETLKGMVQVFAQVVASALNAINTSMNLGYSGGFSASEAWQGNTHVSETHSYQEHCDESCV